MALRFLRVPHKVCGIEGAKNRCSARVQVNGIKPTYCNTAKRQVRELSKTYKRNTVTRLFQSNVQVYTRSRYKEVCPSCIPKALLILQCAHHVLSVEARTITKSKNTTWIFASLLISELCCGAQAVNRRVIREFCIVLEQIVFFCYRGVKRIILHIVHVKHRRGSKDVSKCT